MPTKIIIVDDHPAILIALQSLLSSQITFMILGTATNGEVAWAMIREKLPDMVILDLDMSKADGFDLIRKLKSNFPKMKILILSSLEEKVYGGRVRSLGAHGYVNKIQSSKVILSACNTVSQGYTFFSIGRDGNPQKSDNSKLESISDRELQVLKYLGKGHSNNTISEQLNISSKTVATYKSRLFEKLGVSNIADLIAFCKQNKVVDF